MSGVIDENGQQWERCNCCGEYVEIESLCYEPRSLLYQFGRDLCITCWELSPEDRAVKTETTRLAAIKRSIASGMKWAEKNGWEVEVQDDRVVIVGPIVTGDRVLLEDGGAGTVTSVYVSDRNVYVHRDGCSIPIGKPGCVERHDVGSIRKEGS